MRVKTSPEIDKLAPALVKAIAAIEPVVKDSSNPQFRSKYADLSSCLEAARKALTPEGLAVLQPPVTHFPSIDAGGDFGTPVILVSTVILHSSGQWMTGEIALPHLEAGKFPMAQAIGSAITYLRRYSLCAMLSIPTEDDDGEAAMGRGNGSYGGYQQRDDRHRGGSGATSRIASQASRQPAARSQSQRLADAPIDDSFGEPPHRR